MYYVVSLNNRAARNIAGNKLEYVTEGENCTDALLTAYRDYAGDEDFNEAYEEAGSGNALAEEVKHLFDCTEIGRAMVLEYVERRLDGDKTINILL